MSTEDSEKLEVFQRIELYKRYKPEPTVAKEKKYL